MNHAFNVEVAKEVGVLAATVFNSIGFWVDNAKANGNHEHDGKFWTYNSVKAWAEQFPYASSSQIGRALAKLREAGYVETGNYNRNPYDQTLWYTLSEKGETVFYGIAINESDESISQNREMEETDSLKDNISTITITSSITDKREVGEKKKEQKYPKTVTCACGGDMVKTAYSQTATGRPYYRCQSCGTEEVYRG